MEAFHDFIMGKASEEFEPELTHNLKIKAFNVVTKQRNGSLIRLVIQLYHLNGIKESFINDIHNLLKNKQYKEVSIQ